MTDGSAHDTVLFGTETSSREQNLNVLSFTLWGVKIDWWRPLFGQDEAKLFFDFYF